MNSGGSETGFEFSDVHRRVFDFVDEVESDGSGVGVAVVVSCLDLDGVPGFRQDVVLEDAFFDLVEEGYFSMSSFGVVRVVDYLDNEA